MSWQVKLGGQLSVFADGILLCPPENKSVAMLLIGLLSSGANWISREDLARKLYPDSDPTVRRASLRQSLFRLRQWLGASSLEQSKDCLRLAAGMWSYDLLLADGRKASASMIAPGIVHPWMESLRNEWAPIIRQVANEGVASFVSAVEAAARVDPDTARSILVGGSVLTDSLFVDQFGKLLGLTEPKDRRDPLAYEHTELRSTHYFRVGSFQESIAAQMRAYRLACQQRRAGHIVRAGAMVLFLSIEDGLMGEAAEWVDYLQNVRNADTKSLLFCNAKAAYFWNMNRLDAAIDQMHQAKRRLPSENRASRLHFWTNLAVLYAEAGLVEQSRDALLEGKSLAIPDIDVSRIVTLNLAEATRLMAERCPDEAITFLEINRRTCAELGNEPGDWYTIEAMAEAYAIAGRITEAKRLWAKNESMRRGKCTRMTPRVLARRARIMRCV